MGHKACGNVWNAEYDACVHPDHPEKTIRQVVLGSAVSKASLDEILRQSPLDEIEIVDADGNALADVVPAARPGDATYAMFEAIFQSHAEILRRRATNPSPGISTETLLTKLQTLAGDAK